MLADQAQQRVWAIICLLVHAACDIIQDAPGWRQWVPTKPNGPAELATFGARCFLQAGDLVAVRIRVAHGRPCQSGRLRWPAGHGAIAVLHKSTEAQWGCVSSLQLRSGRCTHNRRGEVVLKWRRTQALSFIRGECISHEPMPCTGLIRRDVLRAYPAAQSFQISRWQRRNFDKAFAAVALQVDMPGIRRALDCEMEPAWARFRRALVSQYGRENLTVSAWDDSISMMASDLVGELDLDTRTVWVEFLQILTGERTRHSSGFCLYGYLTGVFVVSLRLQLLEGGLEQVRNLFIRCEGILGGGPDGKQHALDFVASTSWPIDWLDIYVNILPTLDQFIRVQTFEQFTRAQRLIFRLEMPRPGISHDPNDMHLIDATYSARKSVVVFGCITHPSLSLQIPSLLSALFPGVRLQLFCSRSYGSSYAGRSICDHICMEFPELCGSLVIEETERHFCNQFSSGISGEAQPYVGNKVTYDNIASLLTCDWYPQCLRMLQAFGTNTPLISYYAGAPWNSYKLRVGDETATDHFAGLLNLQGRDIIHGKGDDKGGTAESRVLLLSDGPLTAETIQAFTKYEMPYASPLSLYLKPRYLPTQQSVLLHSVWSTSGVLQLQIFPVLARQFASEMGLAFPLETRLYIPWEEMVRFSAVVFFPHGWMSMTFHELYATNTPLFIPGRDWLINSVMLEQFEIRCKELLHMPAEKWAPSFDNLRGHPYSPMLLGPGYSPRQRLGAALYWASWSELLFYPNVKHFDSLPQLVRQLSLTNFAGISRAMASTNREMLLEAARFWPSALGTLLGNGKGL